MFLTCSDGLHVPKEHGCGILRMSGIELGNNDRLEKQQTVQVLVAVILARCFPIKPSCNRK